MRSICRAALLGATILLLSTTTASATTIAMTTDEAGNTWKLQTGVLSGGQVREFSPTNAEMMHFSVPITSQDIAVDGHVYVTNPFGVEQFTISGALMRTFDQGTWSQGGNVGAIAVNPTSHQVYVGEHNYVSDWTSEGEDIGGFQIGNDQFGHPMNVSELEVSSAGVVSVWPVYGPVHKWQNVWEKIE